MALRYLLDTNIVSDLVRNPKGAIASQISIRGEDTVCTSVVVAAELRYGAEKSGSRTLGTRIDLILSAMDVLPLEPPADRRYGDNDPRTEVELDRFTYRVARTHISEQPGMFAYASTVRVGRLWNPLPHRIEASESTVAGLRRYAVGFWYAALFVAAIIGFLRRLRGCGPSGLMWGMLLAIALTTLHSVYWSDMRMRAPLMPLICLLAVAGLGKNMKSQN